MEPVRIAERLRVESYLGGEAERSLADDVLDGLTRPFKELPPKYLYDARGSQLFDRICELPEYYPTRTERTILRARAADIVAATGAADLVEPGSGSANKTRVLLDAMAQAGTLRRYVPLDVSQSMVLSCADALLDEYPGLRVHALVGDFERHLDLVPPPDGPRIVAFLGGTIGNFVPGSRRGFLRAIARALGPEGVLLLGADLVKDPAVLEAAYNDAAGVTAEFNRNVLHVVNRELGADFRPERFEHVAFFDPGREWIEMRLRSCERQVVTIPAVDLKVHFAADEELRTEISAKFTPARLEGELAAAGLDLVETFVDPQMLFAVSLARRA